MTALGIAALVLYVIGYGMAFVVIGRWIAADEARQKARGKTTFPDWLNGALVLFAAFFWPVVVVCWLLGRLYVLTARRV